MTVRTRFAPSPTGRLHLGNVRAAAFNWLFTRRHEGAFLLRVEDTDVARNVEGSEAWILEDLRWLGLDWDEGPDVGGPHAPYRQSERGEVHGSAVDRLLDSGAAYACFCREDAAPAPGTDVDPDDEGGSEAAARRYSGTCRRLAADERASRVTAGEAHVVRFAVPEGLDEVVVEDEIFGAVAFPAADIDDFVIRRTDGRATYNFVVVVDDIDMRITHVVRGVGHLSNTPKQVLLFRALGAEPPAFAHLPTVLGGDGRKLSKRESAASVDGLRRAGYPPDAVVNYLSLLGWSHPDGEEVLTRDELVRTMSLDRVGKSDTQMDPDKLRWVSQQHLAREDLATLTAHVEPFIDRDRFAGVPDDPTLVVDALRTRLSTYADINDHLGLLYPEDEAAAAAIRREVGRGPGVRAMLALLRSELANSTAWEAEALGSAVRSAGARSGLRGAALFHPLRALLIGAEKGPDLGKILAALGKDEALRRIEDGLV